MLSSFNLHTYPKLCSVVVDSKSWAYILCCCLWFSASATTAAVPQATLHVQDNRLMVTDETGKLITHFTLEQAVQLDLPRYNVTLETPLLSNQTIIIKSDTININYTINTQGTLQLFADNTLNINAPLASPNMTLYARRVTRIMHNLQASGTQGGTIQILGKAIYLLGNAVINVSGQHAGGLVRVGGDYQGQGNIPTADTTFAGPNVQIRADVFKRGRAGQVFVWANQKTEFRGLISAQALSRQGEKGVVDVGGRQQVIMTGRIH